MALPTYQGDEEEEPLPDAGSPGYQEKADAIQDLEQEDYGTPPAPPDMQLPYDQAGTDFSAPVPEVPIGMVPTVPQVTPPAMARAAAPRSGAAPSAAAPYFRSSPRPQERRQRFGAGTEMVGQPSLTEEDRLAMIRQQLGIV